MNFAFSKLCLASAGCLLVFTDCSEVIPCDAEVGVCPRPKVGVVVNDAGVVKSIWLDEPNVTVSGLGLQKTICRGDLDVAPGEEVLFLGDTEFVVVPEDPTFPRILSRVSTGLYATRLIDVEGDGNIEYLDQYYGEAIRLRNHTGDVQWEVTSDSENAPPFLSFTSYWLDVVGDTSLEILINTQHGVELRSANGTVLATMGVEPYETVFLAQLDEDADLELVARTAWNPSVLGRIDTFDLDGTLLGSIASPDSDADWQFAWFYVAADPNVAGLERIVVDCKLYDPAGNEVGVLERDEYDLCHTGREILGMDQVDTSCDLVLEMNPEPFNVQLSAGSAAHRIDFSYSFERYEWNDFLVSSGTRYNPKRTILKIFDPNGALVYHEVLGSKSGPGSFTVIPSQVEGAEVLLVADDSTVFAYTLPANAP